MKDQNKPQEQLINELLLLRKQIAKLKVFECIVNSMGDGVVAADEKGKFIVFNPAAEQLVGMGPKKVSPDEWSETYGAFYPDGATPFPSKELPLTKALQGEETNQIELFVKNPHVPEGIHFSVTGRPLKDEKGNLKGGVVVFHDIAEHVRLHQELARAQRMETAGHVAGQIAHDFNNLLSPLTAYPCLIREELPADHPVLKMVDEMEFVGNKIAEINQQLLALSRRGHYAMEPIDLSPLVHKIVLTQSLRKELVIHEEFASDLFLIQGGSAQLTRALINLIANAKEAICGSGVLTIRTENVYLDKSLKGYKSIKRGEYVKLEISDTGAGIEPEFLDKIFDPFFTTKKMNTQRGSGLGLSIVHSIIEDHHGYITVNSVPGQGTTFSLYFPITIKLEIAATVEKAQGGNESILVVDDDPVQRRVAHQLLKLLGYDVHTVSNGNRAIAYVKNNPQDLLVVDMIMDDIDGAETYRQILEYQPEQRAIILSGYAISPRVEEALRLGAGSFVTKPITLKVLASAIRKELDKTGKKSPPRDPLG